MANIDDDFVKKIRRGYRRFVIFLIENRVLILLICAALFWMVGGFFLPEIRQKFFSEAFKYFAGSLLGAAILALWEKVTNFALIPNESFWLESDECVITLHFQPDQVNSVSAVTVNVKRNFEMRTNEVGECRFLRVCKGSWDGRNSFLIKFSKRTNEAVEAVDLRTKGNELSGVIQMRSADEVLTGQLISTEGLSPRTRHYAYSVGSHVKSAVVKFCIEGNAPQGIHAYLYGESMIGSSANGAPIHTPIKMMPGTPQQFSEATQGYDLLILWDGES